MELLTFVQTNHNITYFRSEGILMTDYFTLRPLGQEVCRNDYQMFLISTRSLLEDRRKMRQKFWKNSGYIILRPNHPQNPVLLTGKLQG